MTNCDYKLKFHKSTILLIENGARLFYNGGM